MRFLELVGVGVVGVAASGLLAGCEVEKQFAAQCTTSPPVPRQGQGFVDIDVEVPPKVTPGTTFEVRVDSMTGYPFTQGGSGSYPNGVISVTGPVTPSGTVSVGRGLFGGTPYPNTIELTVTGEPGDKIRIGAVRGSSFFGTIPNGFVATCSSGGDNGAEVVLIPIVEP